MKLDFRDSRKNSASNTSDQLVEEKRDLPAAHRRIIFHYTVLVQIILVSAGDSDLTEGHLKQIL